MRDNAALCDLARLCPQGRRFSFLHLRRDFWERCRYYSRFEVWVAEKSGRVLATGSLAYKDVWLAGQLRRVVYLFDRMVHPDYRRQGLGSWMLQHELRSSSGADLHYALVLEDNWPNRKLLEKAGFRPLPVPIRYFLLLPRPGPVLRSYRLDCQLREPIAADHAAWLDRHLHGQFALMDMTRWSGTASFIVGQSEPLAGGILYRHGLKLLVHAPWYYRWASFLTSRIPPIRTPLRLWTVGHLVYRDRPAFQDLLSEVSRRAAEEGIHGVLMPVAADDPRLKDFRQVVPWAWLLPTPRVFVYVRGPAASTLLEADLPVLPSPRDG